jgi:CheY-like chemotaxis protein
MEKKGRVLIIEEHPDNGRYLTEYFRSEGYDAIWTKDSNQVLEYCMHFQPDTIILETRVGNNSGTNLLEVLKQSPGSRHIPVICISANTRQNKVDEIKKNGATAFLAKPFNNVTLGRLVDSLCSQPAN